jgi:methionyl-tRNA formyltransferase
MKKRSETIVFFGNEKLATGIPNVRPIIREAVENAGFEIEKIVTGDLSQLGEHSSKLAVLAAYGRIIPRSVLDQFPLGIINVHPSLLPEYRGSTPIEQAILDGKKTTGVSIMKLEAGMDTGPVYKQKTVHLTGNESKIELTEQLQRLGAELLVEVLPDIADGSLKPRSQPHPDRATYSRLLSKADGLIDWSKPADILAREIKAFLGWPQSRTTLGSVEVIITKAHVSDVETELSIRCGDGKFLSIDSLKPLGKKEMPTRAFLAGYKSRI